MRNVCLYLFDSFYRHKCAILKELVTVADRAYYSTTYSLPRSSHFFKDNKVLFLYLKLSISRNFEPTDASVAKTMTDCRYQLV